MSFGAMAAWQAWLLLFAAAGAAAGLFLMKVRPPRVPVASLLLWRKVLDQARELTWWERVRKAISLVATVLIALALAAAVARPGPRTSAASRGRTLIVLDSSWSMLARTPDGGTRWDRAAAGARALAASLGGDEVAIATTADGLVEGPSTDSALIETAIESLRPSGGEGAAWPRIGAADAVHFFTDGGVARSLDPSITVHSVFEPAANVGVTAFGARPAATGRTGAEAYLEIANYHDAAQTVSLTVTRGTAVVFDQPVEMAAGEAVRQVIPLGESGEARIRARVTAPANDLAADDEAVAWLTAAEPLRVTIVSPDPAPFGVLLARAPGIRATFAAPSQYVPDEADVIIFDRWVPTEAPARPAIVIAPPIAAPWLGALGDDVAEPRWVQSDGHPVAGGVDPLTLDIKRARPVVHDRLVPVARSTTGVPLVLVRDDADRRLVVLSFSTATSNLAYSSVFPVLVANAVEWLARPAFESPRRPGPMLLPGSVTRVVTPDGAPLPLRRGGDHVVAVLPGPGLYRIESGLARSVVGVNVGSAEVSNVQRTTLPASTASVMPSVLASRPWWVYAVLLALLLATVEWWTWLRRITV